MTRRLRRLPAPSQQTAVTTTSASRMSRRQCWQEGVAPPPSLRRLRSTPSVSLLSPRRAPACRAVHSVLRSPWAARTLIDTLSVVPHPQSEFIAVVTDLDLDPSGLRVTESIPQRFPRNLVDLVTKNRMQVPRFPLDLDAECGGGLSARASTHEFVAEVSDRHREIVAFDGRRP